MLSPLVSREGVLECDPAAGTKLDDDNTGPTGSVFDDLGSFFAFSRHSESDNILEFTLPLAPSGIVHVVLYFFHSPADSIGVPSFSLTTLGNAPVNFTFGDNSDLSQTDSTIRNVSLIISLPEPRLDITINFNSSSEIDWFLVTEVDIFDGKVLQYLFLLLILSSILSNRFVSATTGRHYVSRWLIFIDSSWTR